MSKASFLAVFAIIGAFGTPHHKKYYGCGGSYTYIHPQKPLHPLKAALFGVPATTTTPLPPQGQAPGGGPGCNPRGPGGPATAGGSSAVATNSVLPTPAPPVVDTPAAPVTPVVAATPTPVTPSVTTPAAPVAPEGDALASLAPVTLAPTKPNHSTPPPRDEALRLSKASDKDKTSHAKSLGSAWILTGWDITLAMLAAVW